MGNRLRDFMGGPWPDRIVNAASAVGLGWLFSLIGRIAEMSVAYPVPLGCACAVSFLLGVGVTRLSGYAEAKRRRIELEDERARQESERQRRCEEDDRRRVRAFMAMPFECKLAVAGIRSRGYLTLGAAEARGDPGAAMDRLESMGLCSPDTVPSGVRWTLTRECSSLLGSHPELIADAEAWLSGECDK